LNGTFRDPTSDALQRFTNIGTVIGDKVYSMIYYSPAETYPVYRMIYDQMVKSFEVIPQKSSLSAIIVPVLVPCNTPEVGSLMMPFNKVDILQSVISK
jgi:hypothetical protein